MFVAFELAPARLLSFPYFPLKALEGNMVARMPNYRAQLLHHLPKLEVLDTRAVVQGERQTASLSVRKEAPLQVGGIRCAFCEDSS